MAFSKKIWYTILAYNGRVIICLLHKEQKSISQGGKRYAETRKSSRRHRDLGGVLRQSDRTCGIRVLRCSGYGQQPGAVQGLRSALTKEEFTDKGVSVKAVNGSLVVDLHIAVTYGLNIATTVRSIVGKVRYVTEKATGLQVAKVNVFVDEMI